MDYRTPLLAFPANAKHGTDAAAHLTGDLLPAPALNAQRSNPPSTHDALGPPELLPARARRRKSRANAPADELSFKLSDRGEDAKHEPAVGRRSIHAQRPARVWHL